MSEIADRCRAVVTGSVLDALEEEVTTRGDQWIAAARLLLEYGTPRPAADPPGIEDAPARVTITLPDNGR